MAALPDHVGTRADTTSDSTPTNSIFISRTSCDATVLEFPKVYFRPRWYVSGRIFYNYKEAQLYRNELYSRNLWFVPKKLGDYQKPFKRTNFNRRLSTKKQQAHQKRRYRLQKMRRGIRSPSA